MTQIRNLRNLSNLWMNEWNRQDAGATQELKAECYFMRDLMAAVGLVLLAGGAWWVFPPAGLIVAGLTFLGLAVWSAYVSRG